MMQQRDYQCRTVSKCFEHWNAGACSVLVVSPPGSGKTEIGIQVIQQMPGARVLWVAHTRELVTQARDRIALALGEPVGAIMAGFGELPNARIIVATVQSLLEHGPLPEIDMIVLDEAHHYLAEEWSCARFATIGKKPRELGLTATPERQDGKALGDVFEHLIVAANYSELIAGGWIVRAKVVRPERYLRSDYAQHPVDAWAAYSEGKSTLCFYPQIQTAEHYDGEFLARNVAALAMHSQMKDADRAVAFAEFEAGTCRVLSTVAAAIEGLNVPHCGAAMLGRSFEFIGGYLQATGRVLRAFLGKDYGIVIDLTGASVQHGEPDQDRLYSLTGKAISGGGIPVPRAIGEREEPSVLGLPMGAGQAWALPQPVVLPAPDRALAKRALSLRREIRKLRTRYGADAARKLQRELESLYR